MYKKAVLRVLGQIIKKESLGRLHIHISKTTSKQTFAGKFVKFPQLLPSTLVGYYNYEVNLNFGSRWKITGSDSQENRIRFLSIKKVWIWRLRTVFLGNGLSFPFFVVFFSFISLFWIPFWKSGAPTSTNTPLFDLFLTASLQILSNTFPPKKGLMKNNALIILLSNRASL